VNASYLFLEQLAQRFGLDFEDIIRSGARIGGGGTEVLAAS
jgi:hypothetical protein